MKECELKGRNVIPCDELDVLLDIDDKFNRADFVTLNNPTEDIAQLITLKAQNRENAIALRYCPFCGCSINFMNDLK